VIKVSSFNDELYQILLKEGLEDEEIKTAMRKKSQEFGGFMSPEGMLFLIAKEHGINIRNPDLDPEVYHIVEEEIDYDEFRILISEVSEGMTNIVILGKVIQVFKINEFTRNDGSIGMVGSFLLQDESDAIKVVIWDELVKILQSEYFYEGILVRILQGYSKMGRNEELEIHLGRKGKIMIAPEDLNPTERKRLEKLEPLEKITKKSELKNSIPLQISMQNQKFIRVVRGIVNVEEFKEISLKSGQLTFLLKLNITDEEGFSARIILWSDAAIKYLKMIKDGKVYSFHNLLVKENSYTGEKELIFTKKSSLRSS
jgi:replication factor A1